MFFAFAVLTFSSSKRTALSEPLKKVNSYINRLTNPIYQTAKVVPNNPTTLNSLNTQGMSCLSVVKVADDAVFMLQGSILSLVLDTVGVNI